MPKSNPLFGLKVGFLMLFGLASLLFGPVGYVVAASMFLLLAWVIYAENKQRAKTPLYGTNQEPKTLSETNNQTADKQTSKDKEDEEEDQELDDLLLLDPLEDDEN